MMKDTSRAPSATNQSRRPDAGKALYLLVSLVVLVVDQWSKWLIELQLDPHHVIPIIPKLLNLTNVRNTGVAFGLFAAHDNIVGTWILSLLGMAALAFVAYYFRQVDPRERGLLVALALVLGGAVGNLIDRLASGGVTDFIDFYFGRYHWHTFNVADSAITVGIILMILTSLRRDEPAPAETEEPGSLHRA